jgi:hypothetical protein
LEFVMLCPFENGAEYRRAFHIAASWLTTNGGNPQQ